MTPPPDQARSIRRTVVACVSVVAAMIGAAYAAVPLYDLFCRVTGFGGTPMIAAAPAERTLDRTVMVRFDANVTGGLNWRFSAESPTVQARLGETMTVMYKVRNAGPEASTGIASFNVQPALAGAYFNKIQCFCFTEQTLQPGETMESAVVFFVDPALADDPNVKDITSITLSYTYFPAKGAKPVTTSAAATGTATR
jgi:cytochrome c oxidase assembly protein subunit 11